MSGGKTMRFNTRTRLLALIAVVALVLPSVLLAQSTTQGAISGTVVDASNAVVPSAPAKLKSLDKGYTRNTTTNGQGVFLFPLVDPGPFSIEVVVSGFKQYAANTS